MHNMNNDSEISDQELRYLTASCWKRQVMLTSNQWGSFPRTWLIKDNVLKRLPTDLLLHVTSEKRNKLLSSYNLYLRSVIL